MAPDKDAPRSELEECANMHRILRLAPQYAVRWKLLAGNPADNVDPPRWERHEQAWLDLEQAQALVQHLEATSAGRRYW